MREIINRVLLFINCFVFFRKNGRMNILIRNYKIRKKVIFRIFIKSFLFINFLFIVIVERMIIIRIVIRFLIIKVLNIMFVNCWLCKLRLLKVLIIIVVDDMDNILFRNIEFIVFYFNRCFIIKLISNILIILVVVVINVVDLIFINFLKLNLSLRVKSKKIIFILV